MERGRESPEGQHRAPLRRRRRPPWLAAAAGITLTACGSATLARGDATMMTDVAACEGVTNQDALATPLLPSCAKCRALQRFWEGRSAVAYWHVQKTGGTTMCSLALKFWLYDDVYFSGFKEGADKAMQGTVGDNCRWGYINDTACKAFGWPVGPNCQHHAQRVAAWPIQVRAGRRFFAMEPEGYPAFPYYWYNMEWFADASHPFWDDWFHVLTVRDPAERFFSDFKQREFEDLCDRAELSLRQCIGLMLHAPDQLDQAFRDHGMSGPIHLFTVRERLLSNMLVVHLSGTPADTETAIANMRRMGLILDAKARTAASTFLVQKAWNVYRAGLSFSEAHRRGSSNETFEEMHPDLYLAVRERLAPDFQVWREALRLIDEHAARLGYVPE